MERRSTWESRSTWPLLVLGVLFVAAYSVYVLVPDAPRELRAIALLAVSVAWLAFIVDLVVRVVQTPRGERFAFLRAHPLDLLSAALPVFRAMKVVTLLGRLPYFHSRTSAAVRTEVATYAIAYIVVFVYFIALATLQVERDAAGANILTFGDAVWWAMVTIATVGYGEVYPVTLLGRAYAVLLMFSGILVIGAASGIAISYITEKTQELTKRATDRSE